MTFIGFRVGRKWIFSGYTSYNEQYQPEVIVSKPEVKKSTFLFMKMYPKQFF